MPRRKIKRHVHGMPLTQARRGSSHTQQGSRKYLLGVGSMGCGVDVVELPRFRQVLKRGGRAFLRRIFTPAEAAYARRRHRTTLLHLAGRFAAKEAVLKAISQIEPTRVLAMNQVEVRNDQAGRPRIALLDGRTSTVQVHVSLSHVKTVAVASAIAIR